MESNKDLFHEERERQISLPQIAIDRESISLSANNIINSVKEGIVNPLDIATKIKALLTLIEEVKEGIKEDVITEALKSGKKSTFNSSEITIKEAGVRYNFEICNDPEWQELKDKLKAKEAFLKNLDKPMETFDKDGVVFTIYTAIKSSTTTYEITLPKK